MFRGEDAKKVCLSGVDYCAMFTLVGEKILVRHYAIRLKRSGSKVRRVIGGSGHRQGGRLGDL
jgi:hypothetical protein